MDFAIVIERLVSFFLKMCEIELEFSGIKFTLGSAVVWIALVSVVAIFWSRLRGE